MNTRTGEHLGINDLGKVSVVSLLAYASVLCVHHIVCSLMAIEKYMSRLTG